VTVKDSGQGIDPEFLPRVFDRFRQADSSTTRSFGGLGLGLAIVRHLVELHGGTVSAYSDGTGRGATFSASFPLITDRVEASSVMSSGEIHISELQSLDGLRVLLVDDDSDTLNVMFGVCNAVGAMVLALDGLPHRRTVAITLLLLPGLVGGLVLGRRLAPRLSPSTARRLALAVVGTTGVASVVAGLL